MDTFLRLPNNGSASALCQQFPQQRRRAIMYDVCCCNQSHHGRILVFLVSVEYRRAFARQRNVYSHRWRNGPQRYGSPA